MSGTEGIDQNGGSIKEAISCEDFKVELVQTSSDQTTHIHNLKIIMNDTTNLSDIDTSMIQKDSLEAESKSALSDMNENQEGKEKVNKSTNENEDNDAKIDQEEASNQSRELKSLLALSKEARLDTNISRKRKVLNLRKKVRSDHRFSPGKVPKIQYPVTAESELEMELHSADGNKMETQDDENASIASSLKALKRKKSILSDTSGDSVTDEIPKKSRKSFSVEVSLFKPNKDMFCWRCHKDIVNISCETCPRSYHQRCLKQTITDPDHWPCPECVSILKAESTQSRSPAMRGMTLENLCSLLKFAVNRMIQCQGSEPFIHAVNDNEFPEYKKYIIQPMDLTLLEKNIKENLYGSTQAFEADAKWILHNSIIFNSYQSKLTTVAKFIIKICKQEMSEIENCPSCYLNANTKKKTWFVEVCPKPHLLVWAKLRGFPFWPGKAMSCKDGMVDVRFFGAHDRAWVPEKECFLYSPKDPNLFRVKRADIERCVEELEDHVKNLKKVYGDFSYPPFKTPLDPESEVKQLQMFLPRYKSYFNKHKIAKRQSIDKEKTELREPDVENENPKETLQDEDSIPETSMKEEKKSETQSIEDETMEGYGTDDESVPEIDTELRKTLLKKTGNDSENDSHEADEDDTQMPTNIEPDTSGFEEVVLTRKTIRRIVGDRKSGIKKSGSEPSSKRPSIDESSPHSIKTLRRNSDTKTESTRMSDKISRVNIAEDMEISLGNDDKGAVSCIENVSSSNSECSSDFNIEIKKKPVQVDVHNVEFTISPASKLKIADKLMKRLSDGECGSEGSSSGNLDKIEQVKRNIDDKCVTISTEKEVEHHEAEKSFESEPTDIDPVSSTDNNVEKGLSKESQINEANTDRIKDNIDNDCRTNTESRSPKVDDLVKSCVSEHAQKITGQVDDLADTTSNNFPNETIHKDLNITETTTEQESLEIHDDEVEDFNKTNDTCKDACVKLPAKEGTPKSHRINFIMKAVRSEEKLDQLMKKSMEEEKNLRKQKGDDVSANRSEGNRERCDSEKSEDVEADAENSKTSENEKHPHEQPLHNKTPSPEKNVTGIFPCQDGKENASNPTKNFIDTSYSPKPTEKDLFKPLKITDSQKNQEANIDGEDDEAIESLDGVNLQIDKVNIINIIHSSLNDTSSSLGNCISNDDNIGGIEPETRRGNKRKKSIEFDESVLETQNKVLKLVSIESIMNKANNNKDNNKEKDDSDSILKTSLQAKKISRPVSIQNSPSSSNRNSIYEISPEEIKSEPESEAESTNVQDMEAKKKYLSALNILEKGEADAQKPKPNEIRTRSKTEEKRERFRVSNEPQIVDNMTKIIEDVAVNYSAVHEGEALPPTKKKTTAQSPTKPDGCEIFVKSFAKIVPDTPTSSNIVTPLTKQRARKSFPQPNYNKPVMKPSVQPVSKEQPRVTTSTPIALPSTEVIPRLTPRTQFVTSSPVSSIASITSTQTPKPTVPPLQQLEALRPTNGYLILQPPQQDNVVFLPPNQTINYTTSIASQVMSVTPCLVSAPANTQTVRHIAPPQMWQPAQSCAERESLNVSESQNYIPQGEFPKNSSALNNTERITTSSINKRLVNGLPEPILISSTGETSSRATSATPAPNIDRPVENNSSTITESSPSAEPAIIAENGDEDGLGVLNSLIPENVSRAVSEIIRRPPPKLKPRPPGILSQEFSDGFPSSAGPVTAMINSVAHRLGDYFRGMLIETLGDLGKTSNSEATIANLRLENETLKHKYNIEVSEIEKNMSTILKDIQQSVIEDRERVIEETRAACEAETIKKVEEAKSKQWCANCSKEAQFYCCWNTSYCDYPCQQKHWPSHMNKCTQNVNQPAQITPSPAIRPGGQQLILRPANPPPKGGIGRVFTKPLQKVYMNRNVAAPKSMRVQTSAGNLLTMMETTPGNYQLVTSNPLVRTGAAITSIRPAGLITVPSPGNASIATNPQQKSGTSKQPIRVLGHSIPVTTVLDEESD